MATRYPESSPYFRFRHFFSLASHQHSLPTTSLSILRSIWRFHSLLWSKNRRLLPSFGSLRSSPAIFIPRTHESASAPPRSLAALSAVVFGVRNLRLPSLSVVKTARAGRSCDLVRRFRASEYLVPRSFGPGFDVDRIVFYS